MNQALAREILLFEQETSLREEIESRAAEQKKPTTRDS